MITDEAVSITPRGVRVAEELAAQEARGEVPSLDRAMATVGE